MSDLLEKTLPLLRLELMNLARWEEKHAYHNEGEEEQDRLAGVCTQGPRPSPSLLQSPQNDA